MHSLEVLKCLRNLQPSRQHSNIRDEADITHELIALRPRIATQHSQLPLIRRQSKDRVERGGLAGAVRTDESEDSALFNAQIDSVQRDGRTEGLAQAACF